CAVRPAGRTDVTQAVAPRADFPSKNGLKFPVFQKIAKVRAWPRPPSVSCCRLLVWALFRFRSANRPPPLVFRLGGSPGSLCLSHSRRARRNFKI
ncbi:unnamed protein product, partial [Amoebophrya sp. A120]